MTPWFLSSTLLTPMARTRITNRMIIEKLRSMERKIGGLDVKIETKSDETLKLLLRHMQGMKLDLESKVQALTTTMNARFDKTDGRITWLRNQVVGVIQVQEKHDKKFTRIGA